MTDRSAVLQELYSRTAAGIKPGLERIEAACAQRGDPHRAFRVIHVAGTNGKGSTAAMIESMLRSCGIRTGLFTSPHLVSFEERFLVHGEPVTPETWMEVYRDVEGVIRSLGLTFFEACTLFAFEIFRRAGVEWAVVETGLGGRWDATNVVRPRASVITSLAMDHEQYLGETLHAVAAEKLGIVKPATLLVMSEPAAPGVREQACARCRETGSPLVFARESEADGAGGDHHGTSFSYKNHPFHIPLAGRYQVSNALCALQALEGLGFDEWESARRGLAQTRLPGRFQCVRRNRSLWVLDVAHNPGAFEALMKSLAACFPRRKVHLVTGIMKDKDIAAICRTFSDTVDGATIVRPDTPRAASPDEIRRNLPARLRRGARTIPAVADAIRLISGEGPPLVCVAGSFFTVGEAMTALGIMPYGDERYGTKILTEGLSPVRRE